MINWKELFEGRNVFHCESEELANKLLNIAHDLGYKWRNKNLFTECNAWENYKENTCYNIKSGGFCEKKYYQQNDYNIINAKELLKGRKTFKLNR